MKIDCAEARERTRGGMWIEEIFRPDMARAKAFVTRRAKTRHAASGAPRAARVERGSDLSEFAYWWVIGVVGMNLMKAETAPTMVPMRTRV